MRRHRDIWNHDVVTEMKFRLVEDPPAAGTTATAIERPYEVAAQARAGHGVPRRWPRRGVELPVENLGDEVVWHREQILVGRPLLRRDPPSRHQFTARRARGDSRQTFTGVGRVASVAAGSRSGASDHPRADRPTTARTQP